MGKSVQTCAVCGCVRLYPIPVAPLVVRSTSFGYRKEDLDQKMPLKPVTDTVLFLHSIRV